MIPTYDDPNKDMEVDRLIALANLQRLRQQFIEAEDTCRRALEIAPNDVIIKEMLGDLLYERGKLEDALAEYKSAMQLAPGKESIETKYAKLVIEIAERDRQKAIVEDMINNPQKYTFRKKNPGIAFLFSIILPGLGQFYNGQQVKAGVLFGIFLLFLASWAAFPGHYSGVTNISDFFALTNPLVLILGFLSVLSYLYGIFDAVLVASKSSVANKVEKDQLH